MQIIAVYRYNHSDQIKTLRE